jgi:nucleoside-diphosphate-sugar epimerase
VTIAQLAEMVAAYYSIPQQKPTVGIQSCNSSIYVPDVTRAFEELGLEKKILLPEAISRTSQWYQNQRD